MIAFAALAPLQNEKLASVALITYGCPITTLYGALFPAYFGETEVKTLKEKILAGDEMGWWNFWRKTDPIGGPVFGPPRAAEPQDIEVDDPAIRPASDEIPFTPPALEDLRPAWVELAGHSQFFREDRVRECVGYMKRRLSGAPLPQEAGEESTLDLTAAEEPGPSPVRSPRS